ncbi:hypothetical protein F4678DRAFT_366300 [Xylaria arbuscula]|nr:hypothetical protein F4678DRAFT_366300 [Xylaria arbuscula]
MSGPRSLLIKQEDTIPTFAKSKFLDGASPEKKTLGRAPTSSEKETHTPSRRLLPTSSSLMISESEGSGPLSKPLFGGKASLVENSKNEKNPGISQLKSAKTGSGTTAIAANRSGILSRNTSSIPPTLPPAVKERVYSTSGPGARRNISNGPKKLEAFGFVSASSLVAGNATATATATTRNAASPMLKPASTFHSIPKPTNQSVAQRMNPVQLQSATPPTTQKTASAPRTPVLIVKTELRSKHIDLGSIPARTDTPPPLPRTPENPKAVKWGLPLSSSIGTAGDPYAISSDSDSDTDDYDGGNVINDRDGDDNTSSNRDDEKQHSIPPLKLLKSFTEPNDAQQETASDVEAVLKQFPVWLDSPSPTELKYSYEVSSGILRPAIPTRASAKTSADGHSNVNEKDVRNGRDGGKRGEGEGRGKRHIRFSGDGDDAFGPYSSPTKRAAVADYPWGALPARRIHIASSPVPVKRGSSTLPSCSAASPSPSSSSRRDSLSSSLELDSKRQQIKVKPKPKHISYENQNHNYDQDSRSSIAKGRDGGTLRIPTPTATYMKDKAKSKDNEKDKSKRTQTTKRKEKEKKKQEGGKASSRHRNVHRLQIQNLQREIERLAGEKP